MTEVKRPRERPVTRMLLMLDARFAKEMDNTTTHNVNVALRTEQRAHRTWEVPLKLQVKLPEEQHAHLKLEVPFKMSVEATL